MKATIIFFSSTGNTKQMADLLADRLRRRGSRVLVTSLDEAQVSDVKEADLVLLGSPAWSGERVVEPLRDFVHQVLESLHGKRVAFFGSYDWGEGRYFDALAAELRGIGADVHETAFVIRVLDGPADAEAADAFLAELVPQPCAE